MIELRWVPPRLANSLKSKALITDDDSLRVLQYRYLKFAVDASGGLCPGDGWSDWIDVPTIAEGFL